jgi:hypothetical protein
LKDWFRSEGLHAFGIKGDMSLRVKPPVDELRIHDGVVYGTHYHPPNRVHEHTEYDIRGDSGSANREPVADSS